MNKAFQENLCKIINEYGCLVYREDKRLEGLLKDLCIQHKKEINLIMSAVKNGSVEEMLNYNNTYPIESLLSKLINRLIAEYGINEILAKETIDLIAYSLKLINTLEIISEKVNLQINKKIKPSLYELSQNFFYAIEKNDIKKVKEIIDDGINIDITNECGTTALIAATRNCQYPIVKLLINAGANVNIENYSKNTSLALAIKKGQIEIVNLLINAGANIDISNLNLALDNNQIEITKLLIETILNTKNDFCINALKLAVDNGQINILKSLINSGIMENRGFEILVSAIINNQMEIAKLLINAGVDVNIKTSYGDTILMLAASKGRIEIVKLLIDLGADVNIKNVHGNTALTKSIDNKHSEITKLLIQAGAQTLI